MSSYYWNVFSVLLYESSFITKLLLNSLAYSHPCQVRPSPHICSMSGIDIMSFVIILSINLSIYLSFLVIHSSLYKQTFSYYGLSHNYRPICWSGNNLGTHCTCLSNSLPVSLLFYLSIFFFQIYVKENEALTLECDLPWQNRLVTSTK